MTNKKRAAIIKKDITNITGNKRNLVAIIIVSLVMTVFLPLVFILTIHLSPVDSPDMMDFYRLMGIAGIDYENIDYESLKHSLTELIMNNIIPLFFLLIPVMTSSVMAADSFVGEKEKKTLETLLYCPLPLKDIFRGKVLASFLLSMAVCFFSFLIMLVVTELLLFFMTGKLIMPGVNWLVMMFLVSPAAALISISLIVRSSSKAQTSEEAQQTSLFLIMPLLVIMMGQFMGVMMLSSIIFFAIGALLALIAFLLFRGAFGKINYETVLK